MRFRVWVEVMTTQHLVDHIVEVSDEKWAALSEDDQNAYMHEEFCDLRDNVANGGYEVLGDD